LRDQKDKVLETLTSPDLVQEGDFGTLLSLKLFSRTPLSRKFLLVVYRELGVSDGFILTAYFTNQFSTRRRVVWRR
jgi:hypothetical protein